MEQDSGVGSTWMMDSELARNAQHYDDMEQVSFEALPYVSKLKPVWI